MVARKLRRLDWNWRRERWIRRCLDAGGVPEGGWEVVGVDGREISRRWR